MFLIPGNHVTHMNHIYILHILYIFFSIYHAVLRLTYLSFFFVFTFYNLLACTKYWHLSFFSDRDGSKEKKCNQRKKTHKGKGQNIDSNIRKKVKEIRRKKIDF